MGYGNLAYEYDPPIKEREPRRTVHKSNKHRNARARSGQKMKILKRIAAIVLMAASAGYMISQFVAVNETEQELNSLKRQLAEAQAYTSQKVFELEQSVDLSEIEKEATTRLNMQRPESYQTIYIDVKQEDVTEVTADAVESVPNRISAFFGKIGKNIVDYFSIK